MPTGTARWSRLLARPWLGPSSTRAAAIAGICGALLTFCGLAGMLAVAYPAFLSADEAYHLDYAWRVGHGQLPRSEDGITAPGLPPGSPQSSFQHPPLMYALLAPVVTPLLDSGRWRAAVLAGRAAVLAVGALSVLAVGWATRRVVREPDPLLVVGAVAVAAVINPLLGVAAAIYNDTLAVLAATVALGLAATVLRRGPTVVTIAALTTANAVGFATRAGYLVVIIATAAAVVVAVVRPGPKGRLAGRLAGAAGTAAAVVAVPLLAIGWFYARNVRLTGNWTGGRPELAEILLGRDRRPLLEIVTDLDVWTQGVGTLLAQPVDPAEQTPAVWAAAFAVVLAVLGLAVWRGMRRVRRGSVDSKDYLVASLLGLAVVGMAATLARHVADGGGASARYLLPALLPICVGAAYGLRAGPRTRGLLFIAFSVGNAAMVLLQAVRVLERRRFDGSVGMWDAWTRGAELNGLPSLVVPLVLGVLVLGLAVEAAALWTLTGNVAVAPTARAGRPSTPDMCAENGTVAPILHKRRRRPDGDRDTRAAPDAPPGDRDTGAAPDARPH